jgi:hypothetical protein
MRRALYLGAVCAFLVAGCSGHSPSGVAQTYLDSLRLYNYPACYEALSQQDKVNRTLDQFLTQIPLAPDVNRDWFKSVLHASTYKVGEAKVDGDKANVPVEVTRPDLPLWERTIDAKLGGNDGADQVAMKDLTDNTFPKLTYTDNIAMVKEPDGSWKIFVDFPGKDAIYKIHHDAIEAYHKHNYDQAIQLYQQALADLDKEQATGNDGLKYIYNRELQDVQSAKAAIPDAQAYIPKIVLSDVEMKMSASRVPAIFGKMTNSGDKAIDEVQFTVTYYEGKGKKKKQVLQELHIPVATPLEFTDFSRPVLPFIPGETRKFGFRLTAPPDIQQKATPDLEVTSIVFTRSAAPLPSLPTPTPTATATPAGGASPAAAASAAAPPPPPPLPKK